MTIGAFQPDMIFPFRIIYFIALPLYIYLFRFIWLLAEATIEGDIMIINKIAKSDKVPLYEIKKAKYIFKSPLIKLTEPLIKIKFKSKTKFGKSIYIIPASYDDSKLGSKSYTILSQINENLKNSG